RVWQRVDPLDERAVAHAEGLGVGVADAGEVVPVRAAGRKRERRARRVPGQPPLGVERVEERVKIMLVGAATVEQDERPLGLGRRGGLERTEWHVRVQLARGSGSGVRIGSTWARRCSNAGGRMSFSPRCAGSSSVEKPGPFVAISKSTPLGSRK